MTRREATTKLDAGGADLSSSCRALIDCLAVLHDVLKQFVEQSDRKLSALREADAEAMHRGAAREAELLEKVQEHRRARNAILARLAQGLQWPGVRSARLGKIAERIPEPFSSILRARTVALRELATTLEQKNKLAALVARNLQTHVRGMFADIASATLESVVYGPNGNHEQTRKQSWVDAVG